MVRKGRRKSVKVKKKYLDEAQVFKLLSTPYPADVRDRFLLQFLVATGLRRSEAAGLTVEDMNVEDFTIGVHGKGSEERMVVLSPFIQGDLVRFIETQGLGPKDRIFSLKTGKGVGDVVKKYVKAAGLPDWVTAHNLRHTFAVQSLKEGRDLKTLQDDLGHASLDTTEDYLTLLPKDRVKNHNARPLPWDKRLDTYLKEMAVVQ